jgi:hypothetical protein
MGRGDGRIKGKAIWPGSQMRPMPNVMAAVTIPKAQAERDPGPGESPPSRPGY